MNNNNNITLLIFIEYAPIKQIDSSSLSTNSISERGYNGKLRALIN